MVKGFIRLTEKYSGDEMYIRANMINAIIPLKSIIDTVEGSVVYLGENGIDKNHFFSVRESPKSVMGVMEMAERAEEK